jgi:hypothetical protein
VHWEAIHKPSEHGDPRPNMGDYAAERAAFTWEVPGGYSTVFQAAGA